MEIDGQRFPKENDIGFEDGVGPFHRAFRAMWNGLLENFFLDFVTGNSIGTTAARRRGERAVALD